MRRKEIENDRREVIVGSHHSQRCEGNVVGKEIHVQIVEVPGCIVSEAGAEDGGQYEASF